MNKILIIADGNVAYAFIRKIATKELNEFRFLIILKKKVNLDIHASNIEFKIFDPTSLFRIKSICAENSFNTVFIVMQDNKEAFEAYKNIREVNQKVRIILLDNNKEFEDLEDSYTTIIDSLELLANRLYYYLPNVPVTAQTIGLNEGEIMEVLVPFTSIYAFRHIGTIPQIKWRIAAIYRNNKLILPTNATMIRPRDRLLLVGKPSVLINVYNRIKNKSGVFPEPYGRNFYLYLDLDIDGRRAVRYIKEAKYLVDKFNNRKLIVRVVNPNDLEIAQNIKEFENNFIDINFSYVECKKEVIISDIVDNEIGLIMISFRSFKTNGFSKMLYGYKKLLYIFGQREIFKIKEALIPNGDEKELEEISIVAFYIAEALKIKLTFANYSPTGEFEKSKNIIEHFETLSHVYNYPINIVQKRENPIKAIKKEKALLLILPFKSNIDLKSIFAYFKRDITNLIIRIKKHPKLLIPIEENQA